MNQIKERETLRNFSIADWTNLKKDDRKQLHKSTFKLAYPSYFKKAAVQVDQLKGIGVITPQMVKKNGK